MSTPDDATLLAAVKSFRAQNPAMARAKVLRELKAEYGWVLSEKRLKTCMDTHHLNTEDIESRKIKEAEENSEVAKDDESGLPKLQELKADYGWVLSEQRLKTCMDTHYLNTEEIESRKIKEAEANFEVAKDDESGPPKLPPNPLQAQLSQRYILLYGSDKYSYEITPNSDMTILLDVSKTLFFFLIINLLFFRSA
jgi:hypothetical protein